MDFGFPLIFLLIPYVLFVFFFVAYGAFNLYHLMRFGVYGPVLAFVIAIFAGGSVIITAASFFALLRFDWSEQVTLSSVIEAPASLLPNFPTLLK